MSNVHPRYFVLILMVLGTLACTYSSEGSYDQGKETGKETGYQVARPNFPDRDFIITDYGAVENGTSLCTQAINEAIMACSEAGGGRVVIPEGIWMTGPIRLRSNVNLHTLAGTIVVFTEEFKEYPYVLSYFEGQRDYRAMPLIYGDSIRNIAVTGAGIFDGSGDAWRPVKKFKTTDRQWGELVASGGIVSEQGDTWWPNRFAYEVSKDPAAFREKLWEMTDRDLYKAFYRPPLMQLISCDQVLLEGPVFQNSPGWCIHPLMCTNLTVNEIQIKNPWYAQNGDGIDVESCSHVSIRNSHFDVGDDAICIKSGRDLEGRKRGMPTQFVEVENCIVHHGHGGFVVGSEMSGGVSDIRVSNCTFIGTDVGLRFKSLRGRGGVVENIHIENIRMIDIATDAIIFNLFYAGISPIELAGGSLENQVFHAPEVTEETPEFRNISMTRIHCQGADRAVQVLGLPEMPVRNLTISHSLFNTDQGIQCQYASDMVLEDLVIYTKGHPTLVLNNVVGADIEEVQGNNSKLMLLDGSFSAAIHLKSLDRETAEGMIVLGEQIKAGTIDYEEP